MAPSIRKELAEKMIANRTPINSSVLILLYPINNELFTVFIQRHEYNGTHSNQVSFPGGKRDFEDKNDEETALREAWEELGIVPDEVTILGELTDLYVPPSNYIIHPFVGYCNKKPDFVPQISEVKEFFEVSVKELNSPDVLKEKTIRLSNGEDYLTPYYNLNGKVVWGATAMIISEFLEVVNLI
jgi:8-oxo-dGTP pyrophosphatase MutT (NUDIX family)